MRRLFKTEEPLIWLTITLAAVIQFIAANVYDLFDAALFIAGMAAFFCILYLAALKFPKKTADPHPRDERSAHCSLFATRNAFVFTLLAMAAVALAYNAGVIPDAKGLLRAIGWTITASTFVYWPSYLYYKNVALWA